MFRIAIKERDDWQSLAHEYGFKFHTLYGEKYWDESAYYQFTLKQIEQDIEDPTQELQQMCLQLVDRVVGSEYWLEKFCIPKSQWELVRDSWLERAPSLYSRLDLVYNGQSPAKLLENNADTPTSLYETGFWQWLWLEQQVNRGVLLRQADQFNSLQERLVKRFAQIKYQGGANTLYFSCCQDTEEDRGTVQYLEDCAQEAGIDTAFIYIEDIGLSDDGCFTDLEDQHIQWMFKLYPWEFMFAEEYGEHLATSATQWLEPAWKSILSNKAMLPLLWQMYPGHPNLLPAYFADDKCPDDFQSYVKKPIFSREGANISIVEQGHIKEQSPGPYGEEGFIYQAYKPLPKFAENYTLIGSWLVGDEAAGISVREDSSLITQDLSRYMPHIIL